MVRLGGSGVKVVGVFLIVSECCLAFLSQQEGLIIAGSSGINK